MGPGYEIGVIGMNTRKATKDFQQTQGLNVDGKPSAKLVQQIRKVAQVKGMIRAEMVPE